MPHFFTADMHYGDDGIRRFFGRPFASVVQMDQTMLSRTAGIGEGDDLWIVGDFAAADTPSDCAAAAAVFASLPGRKHLVRGNHDPDWIVTSLPWASVHDLVEITCAGQCFVLCHYPLVTWNGVRQGAINLFGHVHTNWRGAEGQVNVGVDQWDFAPATQAQVTLEALMLPPSTLRRELEGA